MTVVVHQVMTTVADASTRGRSRGNHVADWWTLGPAQSVVLVAALIALTGVLVTNVVSMHTSRITRMGEVYATALQAVGDYVEAPYRVRRKDGTAEHRNAISAEINSIQSRMDHAATLLRLHSPPGVADAYLAYVRAAKSEAGNQISEAWDLDPVTSDAQMHMSERYPRARSDEARGRVLTSMQEDLARWGPLRRRR